MSLILRLDSRKFIVVYKIMELKMNNSKLYMGITEWILLAILSVLWGSAFFLIEIAVRNYPPFTVVLGRVGIAAIIMTIYVYLTGNKMPSSFRDWRKFIIMGAVRSFIPFCLIVWGETQIDSNLASILNAATPIFTMIIAHFLTEDEHITPTRAIGVLFGFGGVIIIIGPNTIQGIDLKGYGQIAILGAAFSYGLSHTYGRRFANMPSSVSAAGMLIGATILSLPPALIIDKPWNLKPDIMSTSAVVGLALLSTALAFFIYFRILKVAGANNASLVTFFIPISAIILGVSVLNEQLRWNSIAGLTLILLGLFVINNRFNHIFRYNQKFKIN
jgi:drug/metabolite transporter (DMT)-like permease